MGVVCEPEAVVLPVCFFHIAGAEIHRKLHATCCQHPYDPVELGVVGVHRYIEGVGKGEVCACVNCESFRQGLFFELFKVLCACYRVAPKQPTVWEPAIQTP